MRDFDEGQTIVRWIERQDPCPRRSARHGDAAASSLIGNGMSFGTFTPVRGRKIRDVLEGSDPTIS